MNNKWIKPLLFLTALIIICSALSRLMTRGETLADYRNNRSSVPLEDASDETAHSTAPTLAPTVVPAASPTPESAASSFYYEPLTDSVIARITGISYPVSAQEAETLPFPAVNFLKEKEEPLISYDDLRYVSLLYYDFNGEVQQGELICNKSIAQDVLEIFYELYQNEYQLESVKLIEEFGGDDAASMAANNTSCFNYRVVEGTQNLSKHAYGCAIDINPFYNPYVVYNWKGSGETHISPEGSAVYADRTQDFPYKIDENDLCYRLFTEHGFIWGGNWNSTKDYQHFQKTVDSGQ